MKYHIYSKCKFTLDLLRKHFQHHEVFNFNTVKLHDEINSIESSISSKTEFIILDIDNLDSYDVNKIFINAKIRYKLNVILMHNANLKTCIIPFMYDTLFPKESVRNKRKLMNYLNNSSLIMN
ncbi:hypothetical protein D5F51_22490 (plasmid) [Yersinia hibernica]|uniref:Response regulator n=1 Tax=Yersinia hibernica TaxID=2339259 RepID=A0ABX5R6R8_9GAMM|nr:hypothetical protein [Yersinia enterocolitica]EKN6127999.1 hypothetical protein [Yersinia enterocolitica]EKN6394598.1 hypothetical protein [Yersinia enterocolitica]QAX81350.1 hypothetical protein D5F51_22490 [Yersinia hibernica]